MCVCVCQNENRVPDKWQARQATIASDNERKITEQEEAYFVSQVTVILTRGKREKRSTKSTHISVYLFRNLNRDRRRL